MAIAFSHGNPCLRAHQRPRAAHCVSELSPPPCLPIMAPPPMPLAAFWLISLAHFTTSGCMVGFSLRDFGAVGGSFFAGLAGSGSTVMSGRGTSLAGRFLLGSVKSFLRFAETS